jgi:adenylate kinase family enzyme
MIQKPFTIAFLGRSGCGKGTQAKFLSDHLGNVLYISTGDLFRDLEKTDTLAGRKVLEMLKVGGLPPDWLAYTLWQKELVEKLTSEEQHVILDGALRRVREAMSLDEVINWFSRPLPIPVLIDITREEAFLRLKARGRLDDTDTNINRRLDWYETDVLPVVEYYERHGRLLRISGMPSPEKVFESLLAALGLRQD